MKFWVESGDGKRAVDLYSDEGFKLAAELWLKASCHRKLMYEPTWLGIPIIQYPNDIVMMQELIWKLRPDVIVETGVAHGGAAILYASILELIGKGEVIGIDIEIRKYNDIAIRSHPLSKRITLIEENSTGNKAVERIRGIVEAKRTVLVALDSNHSRAHVLREMELYGPFVTQGSYMVVMDGAQEMMWSLPEGKKEWREDNPLKAIEEFVAGNDEWRIDTYYNRLEVTSNPKGFLQKVGARK
ncbi:MAG TPA: hydroxylase [Nitrospirae bacterium]|nr:hydroxylase [Nitrospirota bacterium]